MMTRSAKVLALAFGLLLSLAGANPQPAEAGSGHIGGGFKVGGAHFSVAFGHQYRGHRSYHYRTKRHVQYDGYRCGAYCYKRSGYNYHHQSCPVISHHFRLNRFHPSRVWDYVKAPYGNYGKGGGHRDYYSERDRYSYDAHRNHDPRYCPYR